MIARDAEIDWRQLEHHIPVPLGDAELAASAVNNAELNYREKLADPSEHSSSFQKGQSLLQVTGAWSNTTNYAQRDGTVGPSPDSWIANKFAADEAPGASAAWAWIAFRGLIPSSSVILMSIGVLLDEFAATMKVAIEDLQARVAALEAACPRMIGVAIK